MRLLILIIVFTYQYPGSRSITANELLTKSSAYHDPGGLWKNLDFELDIETELQPMMAQKVRQKLLKSTIGLNNSRGEFSLNANLKGDLIQLNFSKDTCSIFVNGSIQLSDEIIDKHKRMVNLNSCELAKKAMNYHIYLLGLPMKLIVDGSPIQKNVMDAKYFGRSCYSKVVYEQDTWDFYFDKKTYALQGYEFKYNLQNFGEKIVLDDEIEINGLKIASKRRWYDLKNQLLAVDYIQNIKFKNR